MQKHFKNNIDLANQGLVTNPFQQDNEATKGTIPSLNKTPLPAIRLVFFWVIPTYQSNTNGPPPLISSGV